MQTIVLVYQTLHRNAFYHNPAKTLKICNTYFLSALILDPITCTYIKKIHENNFHGLGKNPRKCFSFSKSSTMQIIWNMMQLSWICGFFWKCIMSKERLAMGFVLCGKFWVYYVGFLAPLCWACLLVVSSLGRYVFGSEISYNKPPPRLPGLGC